MKKAIIAILILGSMLTGCGNKQILDTNWKFTQAKINLGNETITVKVKTWKDYGTDNSIQIVADDGTVYLTDIKNVLLMSK